MAGPSLRGVRGVPRSEVVMFVVPTPRAPRVPAWTWVGLNALLREVAEPAPPRVLLEGRVL
eukprot:11971604-Alexandrium_andersonii.AAC.1